MVDVGRERGEITDGYDRCEGGGEVVVEGGPVISEEETWDYLVGVLCLQLIDHFWNLCNNTCD